MLERLLRGPWVTMTIVVALVACRAAAALEVGLGSADVTPKLEAGNPIWLAGLESNRAAKGVRDKLFARAIVLKDGGRKIALVSVDSIGLGYPLIQDARAKLKDFTTCWWPARTRTRRPT
jgi:hypothetical protein